VVFFPHPCFYPKESYKITYIKKSKKIKKMFSKTILPFLLSFILILLSGFATPEEGKYFGYFSCGVELKDPSIRGIHLVVENCTNVGTFSLGGKFNERWEKLLFFYPLPWEGTFFSLNIDGKIYSNSLLSRDTYHLDPYVVEHPSFVERESKDKISIKWMLPEENIFLEEMFELVENGTILRIRIRNEGSNAKKIGLRFHLDTMLGDNDGAPIYIPGDGLITHERSYSKENINFNYWKAYNRKETPTIISTGKILSRRESRREKEITTPDKFIISNWKRSVYSAWDYIPNSEISILGDSAVILYFDNHLLEPQEEREIVTYYGRAEPILPKEKEFGIAEITTEERREGYCPGDNITILIDVLSKGEDQEEGMVRIEIKNISNDKIFSEDKETGIIKKDSVETIKFIFPSAPEVGYPLDVKVTLFKNNLRIDEKLGKELINLRKGCLISKEEKGLNLFYLTLLFMFLAVVFIAILYSFKYKRKREGTVIFKKIIFPPPSNIIKVTVWNQTSEEMKNCIIKDKIPEEAEIRISTLGVKRSHNLLTWEIGNLKPNEKATLEYKITEGGAPKVISSRSFEKARLNWDLDGSGDSRRMEIISEIKIKNNESAVK
jgi:hypothetical protein